MDANENANGPAQLCLHVNDTQDGSERLSTKGRYVELCHDERTANTNREDGRPEILRHETTKTISGAHNQKGRLISGEKASIQLQSIDERSKTANTDGCRCNQRKMLGKRTN